MYTSHVALRIFSCNNFGQNSDATAAKAPVALYGNKMRHILARRSIKPRDELVTFARLRLAKRLRWDGPTTCSRN